ncbi:OLC1v1030621C1 [Oldenlandia corymbosa var. corymbosa]|uniref:OLC1v1030621C1 n=1 Tax=Oldenlandia corymbosa var. corymbosa TaxID=529605 RepID=A0AAV1CHK3_OLDCO|nr:OLC1v1030621C1 [Oldenlandia corymbosa var. corymbosa]
MDRFYSILSPHVDESLRQSLDAPADPNEPLCLVAKVPTANIIPTIETEKKFKGLWFTRSGISCEPLHDNVADVSTTSLIKEVKFINGTPTLEFEDEEFEQLIAPHRLSLVGKFSYGRPKMEAIHAEFKKIGFSGAYTLALYDLPIEFMHPEVIYSMATALGQPLKVDTPTLNMTRPSVARFCVEVDLTKDLPKSVKVGKKGRKHEQVFTFEHILSYCLKCCKIGHKDIDCRVGKPMVRVNESDNIEVPEKKGIKIKSAKPKWTLKRGDPKNTLEAQIVSLNPLVVKGVEKEATVATEVVKNNPATKTLEAWTAETLAAEETLGAQVDLRPSPVRTEAVCVDAPPLVQLGNRFSILHAAEDDEAEDHTQSQEEQDNIGATSVDGNFDLAKNSALLEVELRNMSLVPQLDPIRSNDDTSANEIPNTEAVHDERELWSDGEIHDDHIVENDQGECTVTKKRGRKSKEERAKQSEGVELRHSLRLQ